MTLEINGKTAEALIKSSEISKKVQQLGEQITRDYKGRDLLIIGILKGSFIFLADLVRAMDLNPEIDFIRVSSYKESMTPDKIELKADIGASIKSRHILLVEDLLDSGGTLDYVRDKILSEQPASLKICALMKKKKNHQREVPVDYLGFEIEDNFIIGYGTDFAEKGRHLPDIYII